MDGVTVHDVVCFTKFEAIGYAAAIFFFGMFCAYVIRLWVTRDKDL